MLLPVPVNAAAFVAATSVALTLASVAAAQDPVALRTGYTPDPLRLTGRTAGARPINVLAAGCRGHVGESADHVLQLDSRFGFLRFFVVAPRDVTLAVRGPDGRWRCSGEPLGGAPREQGAFAPGRYEVWIGSTQTGLEIPYELMVTEFRTVTPLSGQIEEAHAIGGGAELGLEVDADEGRFRDRRLRRGFLPDPREDGGRAGGDIDVGLLGADCAGFVAARPSHVVTLRNDFDYFRVQLGDAAGHTTLVLRTPGGRYFCSSPSDANPHVHQDAWPEGQYRIWVGAQEAGASPEYRICYTEVRPAEGRVACGSDRPRPTDEPSSATTSTQRRAAPPARPDTPASDE